MRPADINVDRLSKRVQQYITTLERDIDYWKQQAHAAATEGESDTVLLAHRRDENRGLPPHSTVRFGTEKRHGHYVDVRKHVEGGDNFRDGFVDVNVMGTGQVIVMPQASNLIVVRSLYSASREE